VNINPKMKIVSRFVDDFSSVRSALRNTRTPSREYEIKKERGPKAALASPTPDPVYQP
jgi:hypothetical protein